jgi:hypothetical protein
MPDSGHSACGVSVGKEVTPSMAVEPVINQTQASDHCFSRTKPGVGSSLDQFPGLVESENWEIEVFA